MQRWVCFVVFFWIALFASNVLAHTLIVFTHDNEDGTITIEAVYSTQEIPVWAEVRLEDDNGKVLWKGKIDEDGLCTFKKPDVFYRIIVEAGPGHKAVVKGR
jgi:hypothetical protein